MIAHLHVRFNLLNAAHPVQRDVLVPDYTTLAAVNSIINVCFGWPDTDPYEFVSTQPPLRYTTQEVPDGSGAKTAISTYEVLLSTPLQKCSALVFHHHCNPADAVQITLLNTPALLPTATFKLDGWQGENLPCQAGGKPFDKKKVAETLQNLHDLLYFPNEQLLWDADESYDLLPFIEDDDESELLLSDPEFIKEFFPEFADLSQEEAKAILNDLLKDARAHLQQIYTLKECFKTLNKEMLLDLMRFHQFHGYSKLRRHELEQRLEQELLQRDFFLQQLNELTLPELDLLHTLSQVNIPVSTLDSPVQADYLLNSGFCYLMEIESDSLLTMPRELRQLYQQCEEEINFYQVEILDAVHICAVLAVYLYGAFPVEKLLRRINHILHEPITLTECTNILHFLSAKRNQYVFMEDWVISNAFLDVDSPYCFTELRSLKEIQRKSTDFFWPTQKDFESFAFQQTLVNYELYDKFFRKFNSYMNDPTVIDRLTFSLDFLLRSGGGLEPITDYTLSIFFEPLTPELSKQFKKAIRTIWEHTPMWYYQGYTPQDMKKKQTQHKKSPASQKRTGKIVSLQDRRNKKKRS